MTIPASPCTREMGNSEVDYSIGVTGSVYAASVSLSSSEPLSHVQKRSFALKEGSSQTLAFCWDAGVIAKHQTLPGSFAIFSDTVTLEQAVTQIFTETGASQFWLGVLLCVFKSILWHVCTNSTQSLVESSKIWGMWPRG